MSNENKVVEAEKRKKMNKVFRERLDFLMKSGKITSNELVSLFEMIKMTEPDHDPKRTRIYPIIL